MPEKPPLGLRPGRLNAYAGLVEAVDAPAPNQRFQVQWDESTIDPERAAFSLVKEVYNWFGLEDDQMPYVEQIQGAFAITKAAIIEEGSRME